MCAFADLLTFSYIQLDPPKYLRSRVSNLLVTRGFLLDSYKKKACHQTWQAHRNLHLPIKKKRLNKKKKAHAYAQMDADADSGVLISCFRFTCPLRQYFNLY